MGLFHVQLDSKSARGVSSDSRMENSHEGTRSTAVWRTAAKTMANYRKRQIELLVQEISGCLNSFIQGSIVG
jgi:hypothetical protein